MLAPANETDWVLPKYSEAFLYLLECRYFSLISHQRSGENFGQNMRKDEGPKTELKMG